MISFKNQGVLPGNLVMIECLDERVLQMSQAYPPEILGVIKCINEQVNSRGGNAATFTHYRQLTIKRK